MRWDAETEEIVKRKQQANPPKDDDVVHSDQADRQTGIGIDGW